MEWKATIWKIADATLSRMRSAIVVTAAWMAKDTTI
jgi:hypothetical protein